MKVIFIIADSLRRDHLGAYGNDWVRTPNLDRLAAESCVFDNACIGSFPTVPTRRDLFLGHGDKGVPFNRWKGFEGDEVTLAERLGERGIPSMMVTDVQNTVTTGINMCKGFTAWTCNRGQEGDPCWLDEGVPLEYPVEPHLIRYDAARWQQILTNRAGRRVEEDWFAPHTYSLAIEWLQRNHRRDSFFLYIDTFDPHEPWAPPRWYEDLYDPGFKGRRFDAPTYGLARKLGYTKREIRNMRARYAGEITMVDASVGRLLATLEQLGIAEDTLLIFTSDHGTCFDYPGDGGMVQKSNVLGDDGAIWREGKQPLPPLHYYPHYPGVCRIPLLLRMPGQKQGRRLPDLVQPWDHAPTILDAFGMKTPPELWGQSLLPVVRGERGSGREAAVLGCDPGAQVMAGRWMYNVWRGQRPRSLVDLQSDPTASRNVARQHPAVVTQLHAHLEAYLRRQGLASLIPEYH